MVVGKVKSSAAGGEVEKLLDMSLDEIIAAQAGGKRPASKPGAKKLVGDPSPTAQRADSCRPSLGGRTGASDRPGLPPQVKVVKAARKPAAGAGAKVWRGAGLRTSMRVRPHAAALRRRPHQHLERRRRRRLPARPGPPSCPTRPARRS
jgi:hypothetical protein